MKIIFDYYRLIEILKLSINSQPLLHGYLIGYIKWFSDSQYYKALQVLILWISEVQGYLLEFCQILIFTIFIDLEGYASFFQYFQPNIKKYHSFNNTICQYYWRCDWKKPISQKNHPKEVVFCKACTIYGLSCSFFGSP